MRRLERGTLDPGNRTGRVEVPFNLKPAAENFAGCLCLHGPFSTVRTHNRVLRLGGLTAQDVLSHRASDS